MHLLKDFNRSHALPRLLLQCHEVLARSQLALGTKLTNDPLILSYSNALLDAHLVEDHSAEVPCLMLPVTAAVMKPPS